ncbi:unnamed protein product [Amoebophrya sp. A120]|nr:unnamed protein product [Amoebophrya sp. A120]|eukprot:GSA120T00023630001.1
MTYSLSQSQHQHFYFRPHINIMSLHQNIDQSSSAFRDIDLHDLANFDYNPELQAKILKSWRQHLHLPADDHERDYYNLQEEAVNAVRQRLGRLFDGDRYDAFKDLGSSSARTAAQLLPTDEKNHAELARWELAAVFHLFFKKRFFKINAVEEDESTDEEDTSTAEDEDKKTAPRTDKSAFQEWNCSQLVKQWAQNCKEMEDLFAIDDVEVEELERNKCENLAARKNNAVTVTSATTRVAPQEPRPPTVLEEVSPYVARRLLFENEHDEDGSSTSPVEIVQQRKASQSRRKTEVEQKKQSQQLHHLGPEKMKQMQKRSEEKEKQKRIGCEDEKDQDYNSTIEQCDDKEDHHTEQGQAHRSASFFKITELGCGSNGAAGVELLRAAGLFSSTRGGIRARGQEQSALANKDLSVASQLCAFASEGKHQMIRAASCEGESPTRPLEDYSMISRTTSVELPVAVHLCLTDGNRAALEKLQQAIVKPLNTNLKSHRRRENFCFARDENSARKPALCSKITTKHLLWGQDIDFYQEELADGDGKKCCVENKKPDLVVCSDLAYCENNFVPLLITLLLLTSAKDEPRSVTTTSRAAAYKKDLLERKFPKMMRFDSPSAQMRVAEQAKHENKSDHEDPTLDGNDTSFVLFAVQKRSRVEAALLHLLAIYFEVKLLAVGEVCCSENEDSTLSSDSDGTFHNLMGKEKTKELHSHDLKFLPRLSSGLQDCVFYMLKRRKKALKPEQVVFAVEESEFAEKYQPDAGEILHAMGRMGRAHKQKLVSKMVYREDLQDGLPLRLWKSSWKAARKFLFDQGLMSLRSDTSSSEKDKDVDDDEDATLEFELDMEEQHWSALRTCPRGYHDEFVFKDSLTKGHYDPRVDTILGTLM